MCIVQDRSKNLLYLSQKVNICPVLKCFNMEREKCISTTLPSYGKLSKDDRPKSAEEKPAMAKIPNASAFSSSVYAMIAMCPNNTLGVGVIHKDMANSGKKNMETKKHL